MKFLILFLISFNAMSMIKVDVANNNGKTYSAKFETELLADAWILEQVKKESWGSNKEVEQPNSYFSKCVFAVDEYEEDCTTKYYGPDNYSIVKTDISSQIAEQKAREERIELGRLNQLKCNNALMAIAGYNIQSNKTVEEITALSVQFAVPFQSLKDGRPDKAKAEIEAITDEDAQELKAIVLKELE